MTNPSGERPFGKLTSLVGLLDHAVKVVPAARYFWGVVAASVTVAIIAPLNGLSWLTVVAMSAAIVAMFIFYIFSRIEKSADTIIKLAGYALIVITTLAFIFVIVTSAWLALACEPRVLAYLYGVSEVCYGQPLLKPPQAAAAPAAPQVNTPSSPKAADHPSGPLSWHDGLGYSATCCPTYLAFIISGSNTSTSEIQLKDAYIVSGITGARKSMMVDLAGDGKVLPSETNPFPPGAKFDLWADLSPGLSEREILEQWGKIYFNAEYGETKYKKMIDEEYITTLLRGDPRSKLGPHVGKKN